MVPSGNASLAESSPKGGRWVSCVMSSISKPLADDVPPAPDRAAAACFAAKMALEIGASDPEVERLANDCFSVVATAVAECVRAAQRNGDIDPDADPDDLAYLLLTIVRGSDVVGAYGHSPARLTSIAESAFALLPRPRQS